MVGVIGIVYKIGRSFFYLYFLGWNMLYRVLGWKKKKVKVDYLWWFVIFIDIVLYLKNFVN